MSYLPPLQSLQQYYAILSNPNEQLNPVQDLDVMELKETPRKTGN